MHIEASERSNLARTRGPRWWLACALVAALTAGCGGGGDQVEGSSSASSTSTSSSSSSSSTSTSSSSTSGAPASPVASAKTVAPASVAAGDTIVVSCLLVDEDGTVVKPPKGADPKIVFAPEDSVETDKSGKTIAVRVGTVDAACTFPSLGVGDDKGASIEITPGPVASVDTTLSATSLVAGSDVTATCTAYDAFGNLVPDAQPTLTSTPMEGGNVLTGLQGAFTIAGLYDVACDVPGAATHPVQIEVTPGPPASLVVSAVPPNSLYPVGSVVTLAPLVTDQYGNPITDAPTQYASAPGASATLGANHFQFLTGGFYTLTATVPPPTATGQPLTASVQIEVGGVGPTIGCDNPVDGAMLNMAPGSSLTFQGDVNSPNGAVQVTVNGTPATVSGSTFTASIATRFGINFADVVATDKNGAQSTRTCSFLVANQWAPEGSLYADTIDLKLTQGAVDDGNRSGGINSFADMLYDVANSPALASAIDSSLKASNPLKQESCDSQTCLFGACVCDYSSGITYLGLSLPGPEAVDLTLVNGGLSAHARLPNIGMNLHVYGDVGPVPYDTTGWVTVSYIDVTMTIDVTLSGNKPHASIKSGSVVTSVGSISTNFSGLDGWIINNVVAPLAQGSLQNAVKTQVTNYISNNFNSTIDGAISGLDISTLGSKFNVPRLDGTGNIPLTFGIGFSSLSTTSSRMLAGISSVFTAPPAQAIPSLGIAIPTGTVLDDTTVSSPSTAAVALHVGIFNQAMHALWRGGMFDATLSGSQLGGGLPGGAGAQISTALPPVAAISGKSVELSIGALSLSVTYPGLFGGTDAGGNPLPPLSVELGARATATPKLVGNDLQFGNLTITELHFSTGDVSLDASTTQVLTSMLQQIVQSFVNQSLNQSLPALPIPSFQLPASLATYGVGPGALGLSGPSLGFDTADFVLRGQLGVM